MSKETAERLKAAGLKSLYAVTLPDGEIKVICKEQYMAEYINRTCYNGCCEVREVYPLDQLLAGIEARGHDWEIGSHSVIGGPMMPGRWRNGYWCEVFKDDQMVQSVTREDSPEDAAVAVLLWILEREAGVVNA